MPSLWWLVPAFVSTQYEEMVTRARPVPGPGLTLPAQQPGWAVALAWKAGENSLIFGQESEGFFTGAAAGAAERPGRAARCSLPCAWRAAPGCAGSALRGLHLFYLFL